MEWPQGPFHAFVVRITQSGLMPFLARCDKMDKGQARQARQAMHEALQSIQGNKKDGTYGTFENVSFRKRVNHGRIGKVD